MKRFLLNILAALLVSISYAQAPEGYYSSAQDKQGEALMEALHHIIKDHTVLSYTPGVWNAMYYTDRKSNGEVWDVYSDRPGSTPAYTYTFFDDQCGNYSGEGSCYNREHSFPKSWFSDASPMDTDIFHLYPTDGYVNGQRGNLPFGEVSNPTWTSTNGSKKGPCSYPGYTGTVFEPIDEYKGDFARTYFYMATRYYDQMYSWSNVVNNGTRHPAFEEWVVNLLLEWHTNDPVSEKEINRNNAIFENYQHNRNPFIDHPEYALLIWSDEPVDSYTVQFTVTDGTNPIQGAQVTVSGYAALPTTNASGQTSTEQTNGNYSFSVSAAGFNTVNSNFTVNGSSLSIPVTLTQGDDGDDGGGDDGEALLVEYFEYESDITLSSLGWSAHSGHGTNPIKVVAPSLEFEGYHGSGKGNAVALYSYGEDVNTKFPEQTQGTVYIAFMVQTQSTNSEGYFLHLGQTELETNFFARVWVNDTGTGIGIGTGSSNPSSFVSITTGTPWLVVVKLNIDTKLSELFVFNSFPHSEPSSANTSVTETKIFDNVGTIALRQFNENQRVLVDGIRVGTTWAEAVYGVNNPPASTFPITFSVIEVDGSPNGTLVATANGEAISSGNEVDEGAELIFTATPASGYELDAWVIDGHESETLTDLTYSISNLTQGVDVGVRFKPVPPAIFVVSFSVVEVNGNANGTLGATVNTFSIASGDEVEEGSTIIFTASPNDGYRLKEWRVNNDPLADYTDNTYTLTGLNANTNLTVEFEVITSVPSLALGGVRVYPNPFTNTLSIANAELVARVIITDIIGKQVMAVTLNGETHINTSSLRDGV
ncbi:endonuclease, partial [Perlabentimonas gracilis]|uniref:endonuclease n=1 Tax=Perlabentimonas gracilis TaxID=2715279 RepID=UPI001C62A053